ncbi:MAG: hypothetical protein IKP51_11325, partial [Treponema sp.]|nr:hypothetical protein [Treponema sp.]
TRPQSAKKASFFWAKMELRKINKPSIKSKGRALFLTETLSPFFIKQSLPQLFFSLNTSNPVAIKISFPIYSYVKKSEISFVCSGSQRRLKTRIGAERAKRV